MSKKKKLSKSDQEKYSKQIEEFRRMHWGIPATHILHIDDDRFPDNSNEIGRLMELRILRPSEDEDGNEEDEEIAIEIDPDSVNDCHVIYDLDHPKDRLYLWLNKTSLQDLKKIYNDLEDNPEKLNSMAKDVGGHHSRKSDYPKIKAKPLGYLKEIIYYAHKKGHDDGVGSGYVHEMGEEKGGIQPLVAISEDGFLWILGGTYTCPYAGITN